MSSAVTTEGPVTEQERIQSLDTIRGVALFGILLLNITGFGMPFTAYGDPSTYGGSTGIDLGTWVTTEMLFEGTQRALFSILFGAGIILLTSRSEAAGRTDTADIFYRRTIWLVIFGIVHSYILLWIGEILYVYGIIALFLFPLRKLAPRTLLALSLAGFLFGASWNGYDTYRNLAKSEKNAAAQEILAAGGELTEEQQGDVEAWKAYAGELKPDEKAINHTLETQRGSYAGIFMSQAPINAYVESWYMYRYFFDSLSMMLLGMALFKLGVLTLKRSTKLYLGMIAVGYAVGLTTNYFETSSIVAAEFSIEAFTKAAPTYDLGRIGMVAGHLGVLLLFCRSGLLPWLQRALAAVGRMALSNYVMHSIICAFVFYGFGFGMFGYLARHELYYVVFAIWLFQLVLSPIWLKHYRFGPLEWLWRSLTYVKRQPMRRRVGSGATPEQSIQPG